jgi:magnesium transporter
MPGVVSPIPDSPPTILRVIAYNQNEMVEQTLSDPEEVRPFLQKYKTTWLNIDHLGDERIIRKVGEIFSLHNLALEDVVNVHQRAKVEPYPDHLFIVARMVQLEPELADEQLSIFLGQHFLITFQQQPGDCLDSVRERLRMGMGRIRTGGSPYLVYAILDAVIDSYFPIVDTFADRLDKAEEMVASQETRGITTDLHHMRNQLLILRRNIRPHRDAVNELIRDQHPLIDDDTRVFLRDCYDHTIQLIDLLEIYREMCSDIRDFYLSLVSNRMNEIMKVLTIIATIFIPLSFITGIYGMNFDTEYPWNMPELGWRLGYPFVWSMMLLVAGTLVHYFWRKGWLRDQSQ